MEDSAGPRITKIERLIEECPLGIHDISRTELDTHNHLPRFNMPFELGLFLGAKAFGGERHVLKRALVLDRERYRYQQFISDISGNDPKAHHNDPAKIIQCVRDFLNIDNGGPPVPGGGVMAADYSRFLAELPLSCRAASLDEADLSYADYVFLVTQWMPLLSRGR